MPEDVDWNALPEPVRARAVELAAGAIGDLPSQELPPPLRPLSRFVAAKRAKVAGQSLIDALRDNRAFRSAVAHWAHENAEQADRVAKATASLLQNAPDAAGAVADIAAQAERAERQAELDAAKTQIARLEAELKTAKAQRDAALKQAAAAKAERADEIDKLKERLRARGVELKQAREAAKTAGDRLVIMENDATGEVATLRAQLGAQRRRAEEANAQAERAKAQAERARRSAREARAADEVRLGLLLDTLAGAVDGLRVELGSPATTRLPADTVDGVRRETTGPQAVPDADALERLLTLPQAHLIVDGYNVTKTAYPDITLADQRERLVRQLAALGARTGAEVTVVFDGAGVVVARQAQIRGVRVLFSEPGVTADDVIKALVAAEPPGRPLIVATSDREIVTAIREHGAYPVSSLVALDRLERG